MRLFQQLENSNFSEILLQIYKHERINICTNSPLCEDSPFINEVTTIFLSIFKNISFVKLAFDTIVQSLSINSSVFPNMSTHYVQQFFINSLLFYLADNNILFFKSIFTELTCKKKKKIIIAFIKMFSFCSFSYDLLLRQSLSVEALISGLLSVFFILLISSKIRQLKEFGLDEI